MKLDVSRRDAENLARMSNRELRAFLKKCGPEGILMLDAAYELWAAEGRSSHEGSAGGPG